MVTLHKSEQGLMEIRGAIQFRLRSLIGHNWVSGPTCGISTVAACLLTVSIHSNWQNLYGGHLDHGVKALCRARTKSKTSKQPREQNLRRNMHHSENGCLLKFCALSCLPHSSSNRKGYMKATRATPTQKGKTK